MLKFNKRAKIYSNSTGSNTFNPNTFEAHSYKWWLYVKKIGNKIIFNNYFYSSSTSKQQSEMRNLLSELGHSEIEYIEAPDGLDNLNGSIELYKNRIDELKKLISSPRTRKTTNEGRQHLINNYKNRIELVQSLIQIAC